MDWYWLMGSMAAVLFPEMRKRGAPRRWTKEMSVKLLLLIEEKKLENISLSTDRICEILAESKSSPDLYRRAGKEGLIKQAERSVSLKEDKLYAPAFRWLKKQQNQQKKCRDNIC